MGSTMGYIKGIRKQAHSSRYSYRIHLRLPDGRKVNLEKGGFLTPEEAAVARCLKIEELTTNNPIITSKPFEEVFWEYIKSSCSATPSLRKKYIAIYKNHVQKALGQIEVCESFEALLSLKTKLCNSLVYDGRSNERQVFLSSSYISEIKAMLTNIYDYAFVQKYISSHPMYRLGEWTTKRNSDQYYIAPPFAYLGNKTRILQNLFCLFPKDIQYHTFVDLFAGSGTVGVNIDAKRVLFVDSSPFMMGILNGLRACTPSEAWNKIMSVVNTFALSADNEEGYYSCRKAYNEIPIEIRFSENWYWGLVLVYCSFNRSTVQINNNGDYTAPFGKTKVNIALMKKRFFPFAEKIYNGNYEVYIDDYRNVQLPNDAFIYADPPYSITVASYNKGWNEEEEKGLYSYLEEKHNMGFRWALSNVFENNGIQNHQLRSWVRYMSEKYPRNIHVYYLKSDYRHSNYKRKNKGRTVEVLITNY